MTTDPIANTGKPVPPALPGVKPPKTTTQTTATGSATSSTATNGTVTNFDIPEGVKEKYPDLIELILVTKSMNDKEKQYWFHILPVMKDAQVEKLRKILINEKQKLAEIDKKYSQKLKSTQDERINEWKGEEFKEKLVGIKKAELSAEEVERKSEEDLLNQLNSL